GLSTPCGRRCPQPVDDSLKDDTHAEGPATTGRGPLGVVWARPRSAAGPGVVLVDDLLRDAPAVGDVLALTLGPVPDRPVLLAVRRRPAPAPSRRRPAADHDAAPSDLRTCVHVRSE